MNLVTLTAVEPTRPGEEAKEPKSNNLTLNKDLVDVLFILDEGDVRFIQTSVGGFKVTDSARVLRSRFYGEAAQAAE